MGLLKNRLGWVLARGWIGGFKKIGLDQGFFKANFGRVGPIWEEENFGSWEAYYFIPNSLAKKAGVRNIRKFSFQGGVW